MLRLTEAVIDFAGAGNNTIVAASAGRTIWVFRLFLVVGAATVVIARDGAAVNLTGAMTLNAGGSWTLDLSAKPQGDAVPWFTTTAGNAFIINSSNAVQVSGRLYYIQDVSPSWI